MIKLTIDGRKVEVEDGCTVLEAAKSAGIHIPTLCYHESLPSYGACRFCIVEVVHQGQTSMTTSCILPAAEGMEVATASEKIIVVRRMLAELMLARCPESEPIIKLAQELGVTESRFPRPETGQTLMVGEHEDCILCGMCVRLCDNVLNVGALAFEGRGENRRVTTPFGEPSEICRNCGSCESICPTGGIRTRRITETPPKDIPFEFEQGLTSRKPVYLQFPQAVPRVPVIDDKTCMYFKTDGCKVCADNCEPGAIDHSDTGEGKKVKVGAIIVATGFDMFDAREMPRYGYGRLPNVITAMEFERLLSASGPTHGHLDRPSDRAVAAEIQALEKSAKKSRRMLEKLEKKHDQASADVYEKYRQGQYQDDKDRKKWAERYAAHLKVLEPLEALKKKAESFTVAKRLAFIQCVGSRDFRFYPFCSGYCCMHSIKEAIIAHEHEPETTSAIFGMDIRAVSKGFEEYKIRGGNNSNVTYVRGRVSEIMEGADHNPVVIYEDTQQRQVKEEEFDMVILATACAPTKGIVELAKVFGVELDEYNFIKTSSLSPVDTSVPGIFVCGCAESPMDVPESVAQASSAAERAAETATQLKSEEEKAVA